MQISQNLTTRSDRTNEVWRSEPQKKSKLIVPKNWPKFKKYLYIFKDSTNYLLLWGFGVLGFWGFGVIRGFKMGLLRLSLRV